MSFKNIVGSSCLVLVIVVVCLSSVQCAPNNSTDTMMASKDKANSSSSSTTTTKAPAAAASSASSSTVAPKEGSKNGTSNASGEDCEPEAEPESAATGSKNKTDAASAGKGREGKQLNLGDKKDNYGAAPEPEPETKATAAKTNNAQPGATPEKLSANNATTTPAPAAGRSSAVTAPMAVVCLTAFFVSAAAL